MLRLCGDSTSFIREYVTYYKGTIPLKQLNKKLYIIIDDIIDPLNTIKNMFSISEFDIAIFKLPNDTDRCCASLSDEQVQQVINSTSSETINN